ncbi:hypothetical protein TWF718_005179 [Orbilia javanica]|uniref:Uncharacterized protein n=1 Tax=Orbilia javanica TaxID=47235 RepID=A0AAN8RFJ8_9PEZI
MQQTRILRRSPGNPNLKEALSRSHKSYDELRAEISKIADGRTPHEIVENPNPESLLRLLSCLISLKSGNAEAGNLGLLTEFFRFTVDCRRTTNPAEIIQHLHRPRAQRFSALLKTFEHIIRQEVTSLDVLRFVCKEELGVDEHSDEAKKLALLVMVDLPFNVANWTNLWVGLIQGVWGGIWQATLFIRRLRDGRVLGRTVEWMPMKAREMQWAQWQITQRAEGRGGDNSNLRIEDRLAKRRSASEVEMPNTRALAIKPPVPAFFPENKESPEIAPAELPRSPGIGKRRVPEREGGRPQAIYYPQPSPQKSKLTSSPRPRAPEKPKPSEIDILIGKYAKLPRLKYDKNERIRQELARQQRSEEDFNQRLRKRYQEARVRERLERVAREIGLEGEGEGSATTKSGLKDVGNEADKIKRAGAVDELNKLHRRVLEQDKEIEDTSFEEWAEELLAEGVGEEAEDED